MPHHDRVPGARALRRRNRGLRRVGLTTMGVSVAAAAGSVVLGTGYAQSLPGTAAGSSGHAPSTAPASTTPDPSASAPASAKPSPTAHRTASHPHTSATRSTARRTTAPATLRPPTQAPAPAAPTTQAPAPQPAPTTSGAS